jgi:hypothetical protein
MRLRVLAIASLITLAGCHLQTDPPGDAPSGVAVAPGDGQVTVTWIQEPGLTYWIFYRPGGSVVPAAPGVPLIFDAVSPRVVAGLTNGTQYAFIMNATQDDSRAGPSSPVVVATPRPAGADWVSGAALGTPPQNLNGIAFSGSRLVAVGDSATIFAGDYNYTNPPVTAWVPATFTPTGTGLPSTTNLSAVTFSGQFVALGTDGSISTSADGLTWTLSANPVLSAGMNGIAFGAGVYVAVGNGGNIFTSADLVTWSPAASDPPNANDLFGVAFLNGGFVATGESGTLLTSTNGSTWVERTSNTPNTLRGAAFRSTPSGLYVAVGDAGTIVTSTDGTIWAASTLPNAPNLRSVTSGGAFGTRLLAVGLVGAVAYSDDGINWSQTSAGSADLSRVIFTPGMYVAVGAVGANAIAK